MPRKHSLIELKNKVLLSNLYITQGRIVVIYNNSERFIYDDIDFFELVYNGDDLYLNFSKKGTDEKYDERINLTTVHNINGVLINPAA
ncbi:hypothetical protein [Vagococcus luciliae]|uniref:Uncharacterized protein n=1 Tax=Vagococcus luciliae TaxID=2920380 RepID=A0ABY5P1L9_9ENTE|nr:hypothetical protein [Vagococcus luciliae]UUV99812.1 hypothetical protein G314FT_19810 [Vagococcus luciliae]